MCRAAEKAGLNSRPVPKGYSYNWLPAIEASASCASHMAAFCTAATGSLDPDHFQTSSLRFELSDACLFLHQWL